VLRASVSPFPRPSAKRFRVFVYGTLKPGEENYDRYCKNWVTEIQEAMVLGQLFALPVGYPALTAGNGSVYGFLLSFIDPAVLSLLDELEGYDPSRSPSQNDYLRLETQVLSLTGKPLGRAWIYQMQPERIAQARGIWLPEGHWSNQMPSQPGSQHPSQRSF